jgi:hypothetical protein
MPAKPPHLDDGTLQALLDGEVSLPERLRARKHLRFCAQCAARSVAHRTAASRVAELLDASRQPAPDVKDAWKRFVVRRGRRHSTTGAVGTLLAAVMAGLAVVIHGTSQADLVTTMYRLSAQDHRAPKGPSHDDVVFARSLASLEAKGRLHRVSDICCADRDGEGPADDGVLTVTLAGRQAPVVILYEDTKHLGRFQPGDVVLRVSTRA